MKKLLLPLIILFFFSCNKSKENSSYLKDQHDIDVIATKKATNTMNNEQIIEESSFTKDGIYYNKNNDEVFHFNNIHIKTSKLKGKNIKTMVTVSFQGENRNTLILGINTPDKKNLRGAYIMNSYIGKSNGLETFKYEKIEGDNENEYFTFAFADDGKLTVTNLENKDIFIFENKL